MNSDFLLTDLPNELILDILKFLDLGGILKARYVCHFWRESEILLIQNFCEVNGYNEKPEEKSWLWYALSMRLVDLTKCPKFTGLGRVVKESKTYEGEFKEGVEHGFGTERFLPTPDMKMSHYLRYTGDWAEGKKTGKGCQYWSDGGKYCGEIFENRFQGQGTFTWSTGEVHVGQFVDNLQQGHGILTWVNGDYYEGNFENGIFSGDGSLVYKSGTKYVGKFKNGKKEGFGYYSWSTGDLYEGEWFNDLKHGPGIYTWGNKNKVVGEWHEDNRKGGTFYEAVSNREFCCPKLDMEPEMRLDAMSPVITNAIRENVCTYSNTQKKHYFQYLWNVVAEERYAVCFSCKKNCVPKNAIKLKDFHKKIFGGNFICSCGQGLLKSPCVSMPGCQSPADK